MAHNPTAADRLRVLADWCEARNVSCDVLAAAGITWAGSLRVQIADHAADAFDRLCASVEVRATCPPYEATRLLYGARMHQQFAATVDGVEVSMVRDVGPAPAETP